MRKRHAGTHRPRSRYGRPPLDARDRTGHPRGVTGRGSREQRLQSPFNHARKRQANPWSARPAALTRGNGNKITSASRSHSHTRYLGRVPKPVHLQPVPVRSEESPSEPPLVRNVTTKNRPANRGSEHPKVVTGQVSGVSADRSHWATPIDRHESRARRRSSGVTPRPGGKPTQGVSL